MWQKAKVLSCNIELMKDKIIWVRGKPEILEGVGVFDRKTRSPTPAYETNLLSRDGSDVFVRQEVVELLGTEAAFCEKIEKIPFYEWTKGVK